MGTVTKRILAAAAVLVLAAPGLGQADTTWYGPGNGFTNGPAGGSSNATNVSQDPSTGEIRALQYQFTAVSGNLGCTGQGPFAFFDVPHTSTEPVTALTVNFTEAVVSPYAFMKVSLIQDGDFVQTGIVEVGAFILGDGSYTLELDEPVTGDMTARFGIEVSSNCPSVDGGRVLFTGAGFTTAGDQDA